MAGDASAWLESVKQYLQPATKMVLGMKEQMEGLDFPPVVVKTYESAAGAVGMGDVSPFYVGLSIAAAGSVLLLATCGCGGGGEGRKKKKASSKKKKSKAKSKTGADTGAVASNGSAFKNGGSGVKAAAPVANGGAPRGLPAKQTNHKGSGRSGSTVDGGVNGVSGRSAPMLKASKVVKKPPATKSPQVSEKARGNRARGAPPVITEEPEAAKKRVRKKKTKSAAAGGGTTAAAAAGTARASAAKKDTKNGVSANGSPAGGGEGYSRAAKNEAHAVDSDIWEEKHGGEWQTVPTTPPEEEWETVSHKKSRPRPRKEKAAVEAANVIPGGLGL